MKKDKKYYYENPRECPLCGGLDACDEEYDVDNDGTFHVTTRCDNRGCFKGVWEIVYKPVDFIDHSD
jgi:hypothetical protein